MNATFDWGAALPRLEGTRVRLRPLVRGDVPDLQEIFGDPEVTRYWSSPPLADRAAATRLFEDIQSSFASRTLFQWGIERSEPKELIGTCTLCQFDVPHRRAELGIALGRAAWGEGLATDALHVLLRFAFETLGLHRLEADVDPGNERSLRLLERLGFRREGLLRERWFQGGTYHDGVFLGLLRDEWVRG